MVSDCVLDCNGCGGAFGDPICNFKSHVSNLDLWPLAVPEVTVPHYLPVLVAVAGFVGGVIVSWFSAGKIRRKARAASRKAGGLEKNLDNLKQQIEELETSRRAGPPNK